MIPLRDNIPSRITPFVNYAIIALCTISFVLQSMASDGKIAERFGMIPLRVQLMKADAEAVIERPAIAVTPVGPRRVIERHKLETSAVPPALTMVTCMFLHGGLMHFLGNMWFLYIFGDNVEDRLGHIGYAMVYLGTGILAGLAHYLTNSDSVIPTIGASGAIAGVMGAYAWFYPHARVQAVIPLVIIFQILIVPAPVFLGIWFVFQTVSGLSASADGMGGVAWWAHVGGFVAGAAVAVILGRTHFDQGRVEERRF
ncbi:MAG: rhomboid family intramembrane serine protease [Planctomycetota bacterium]